MEVCFSDRSDGDFHVGRPDAELTARRRRLMNSEWTWLRQVHGAEVVVVTSPGEHAGTEADASVTAQFGAVLAVQSADCVPVVLASPGGAGVAHAGWRGIVAGVLPAAVGALRDLTGDPIHALIGPCIAATAYGFGEREMALVVAEAGTSVRSTTADGGLSLDLAAAAGSVLANEGVERVDHLGIDTAGGGWFSHRTRGDVGRQVTAVRLVAS